MKQENKTKVLYEAIKSNMSLESSNCDIDNKLIKQDDELIYRTRKTLNDFYYESQLWEYLAILDTFLHASINNKQESEFSTHSIPEWMILEDLNTTRKICVRIMLDKYPEEETWLKYFSYLSFCRDRIYLMVYSIFYLTNNTEPKIIRVRQNMLHHLENEPYATKLLSITNNFIETLKKEGALFTLDFSSQPELPEDISNWSILTHNYEEEKIRDCIDLWESKEEKMRALLLIEKSYQNYTSNRNRKRQSSIFKKEIITPCWECLYKEIENEKLSYKIKSMRESIITVQNDYNNLRERIKEIHNTTKNTNSSIFRQNSNKISLFSNRITKPELVEVVMNRLHELINRQTNPKEKLKPLCAAIVAGVIESPTLKEYCMEFGEITNSLYYKLIKLEKGKSLEYDSPSYYVLVKEFKKLLE